MLSRHLIRLCIVFILALPVTAVFAQQPCSEITECQGALGLPQSVLDAYPKPNVTTLPIDDSLLYDRIYRKIHGPVNIMDAPGGNVVDSLGAGFTYVTVNGLNNDWSQIAKNEWVPSSALTDDVLVSRYSGVTLPDEQLPYPAAWTMKHLRPASVPGGDDDPNNPFLYRYTLVNLYTYTEVDGKRWYQVGPGQWIHQYNISKITPIEKPEGIDTHKWVAVDLYEQSLVAYEDDKPVFSTLISSGLKDWGTNEGLFHVYLRYERTTMSGAVQASDFYSLQEVPWTMYFDHDIALHGTYWHDGFGYRHSHGCVNMSITDAHWLYQWSASETDYSVPNDPGMAVYVYSSGSYDS